ncbi:DNA breaking-rejoining enzyme [Cylindrobasidium torrendii FP15055 ss-10]|uniref:DNA breaking-rejoining enzyme n=1 Tax=Cylindrobasidium torrendii FP15055 ss-10 TaxID=1314674 RepID=A0A0D7BTG2_9AGAR|nr:DNA breaking-rejoining enzyme [Cylindrobasidium torrendii FP15055 ss-10]
MSTTSNVQSSPLGSAAILSPYKNLISLSHGPPQFPPCQVPQAGQQLPLFSPYSSLLPADLPAAASNSPTVPTSKHELSLSQLASLPLAPVSLNKSRRLIAANFPISRANRPRAGCSIAQSELRPDVPAHLRPFLWVTPYSSKVQAAAREEIPDDLYNLILQKCGNSVVKNTLTTYSSGMLRFSQFCDEYEIPESKHMPASSWLLAAFAAHWCGRGAASTLRAHMCGIAFWHRINLAPWHGKEDHVPAIMRTAVKEGVPFLRPPRGPITLNHLRHLRSQIDISTPRGAAIWAAALCAFWGCRRLGELLISSAKAFDPAHDISRTSPITYSTVDGVVVIKIFIPWTKTTGVRGGWIILTATGSDLCPVAAFDNHLKINTLPSSHSPLFAYRDSNNTSKALTKPSFLSQTSAIYKASDLSHVHGHSYRIGGSSHLLFTGVSPEVVMKIGGWSSLCFLIYWRKLELIVPAALVKAWGSKRAAFAVANGLPSNPDGHLVD